MEDNNQQLVIPKDSQLPIAEDYFALRQEGLSYIEELGSARWTDYNSHDPGITSLEVLCYALSELGYRTGLPIEDLLTDETGLIGFRQAFFTARAILTNNPLTENDFRKILIDLPNIDNGWLICKACYCETKFYAECAESSLVHAPLWRIDETRPRNEQHEHPVYVKGLYDVILELEDDIELGDLNDRKILHTVNYRLEEDNVIAPLTIEVRFPQNWEADIPDIYRLFTSTDYVVSDVEVDRFSRSRTLDEPVSEASFVQGWRGVFYADFIIEISEIGTTNTITLNLNQATIRFFSTKESVKHVVEVDALISDVLEDSGSGSILQKYQNKLIKVDAAIEEARFALHQYRNVGEDFCNISGVCIEDIGVCMDIEVASDADIEWVMANVFNEVELYFNPPVPFYTLTELVQEGNPTEEIFEGPALQNGFIKDEELIASKLKSYVYTSDIINLIMDIEGVVAVKNMLLSKYDQDGKLILSSEPWKVPVSAGCIPKLYEQTSRILFYKNGLPFLPRLDEVRTVLAQLKGERDKPKIPLADNDFPVPIGQYRALEDFYPLQYSYPETYGIGAAGLPTSVSDKRRAQARQMKGYLMTFEQITADIFTQLANAKELFSLDEEVDRTYFQHYFDHLASQPEISGLADIISPLTTENDLHLLTEKPELFYDRRNRFLDHLLARFGEQFRDYALMLYSNADRIAFAPEQLIKDKIRFLNDYPRISAQRAKAFNYKDRDRVCDIRNVSGPAKRISRFLGMETLRAYFQPTVIANQDEFEATFILKNPTTDAIILESESPLVTLSVLEANLQINALIEDVMANSISLSNYGLDGMGNAVLNNPDGIPIANLVGGITPEEVVDFTNDLLLKERLYVVEHLLLRPKFPGDALLPVCLDDDCKMCGEEDPYSFQITYVLQGKLEPFSYDIDLRQFANDTIRKETPAHLLPKVCWVGNDICLRVDDTSIVCAIRDLLLEHLNVDEVDEALREAICLCGNYVFNTFNEAIAEWTAANDPADFAIPDLRQALNDIFTQLLPEGELECHDDLESAYYADLQDLVVDYFSANLNCYQFNTFERAWCKWLEVNALFNWAEETDLLNRRVQHLILNYSNEEDKPDDTTICSCTELLLGYFGNQFKVWIDNLVNDGVDPEDETLPSQIEHDIWEAFLNDYNTITILDPAFCSSLLNHNNPGFWEELCTLLTSTYQEWIVVSYRLNQLIRTFTSLKSIYPAATLHDCDDGSDDNPVRLNNTILGSL